MPEDGEHAARWRTIYRCGYGSPCRAPRCQRSGTIVLAKSEANGRFLRQIEVCDAHSAIVVEREQRRGLGITDRR